MRPADNTHKLFKQLRLKASAQLNDRVHSDIARALEKSTETKAAASQPNVWRIIMKSRITRLATAAMILAVAGLVIALVDKGVAPAYGLGQTVEVNRGMRYLHTKYFDASHEDPAKECWLEFDDGGRVKNVRIKWAGSMGSEKAVVWGREETKMWSKKQNWLTIFNDEIYTSRIHSMMENEDLRLMLEHLYEAEASGHVQIEIDESSNKTEPIIVTATYLPESPRHRGRRVLLIDRATKLVTSLELYVLKDGEYKYNGVITYHDYNVAIDANMFSLDDEVPADATRVDTRIQDVGLAQGDLTDEEIAIEVVRQFIESLMAKDYTRASQLLEGFPQHEIKKGWGKLNIVRLVSIDEPGPPSKPSKLFPKMLCVPYTIEIEKDGERTTCERQLNVRRALGRRERWVVR
jgi:hypothetical protein